MIRDEEHVGGSGNADWCSGLGWLALVFLLLASSVGNLKAQTPNPVTPGYQVCSNASGVTKCSFQAAGTDNVLGTFGLPVSAVTVATCGAQTLTAAVPNVLTLDQTGTLCTSLGSGGITAAVTVANGADVVEGSLADAAATAGGTGTVSAKLRLMTTQLNTIATGLTVTQGTSPWVVSGSGTAGTANAGVVTVQGIASMTPILVTPAANSAVNVAQVNGVTASTGTGAVGTGTIRTAVGTDTATIAGSAPGTAGTASANVVSVQGVASMTPIATQGSANTTLTDCSGTIATGATAQNAFTAAATRRGFTIANIDTTEVLWISFTTTAAASGTGSYPLGPADATTFANLVSFTSPVGMGINTALSVIAATTAHKFSCTVW